MFKLKNFIILLLLLFALAGQSAWAGDGKWMYMHIQVDSYPTAAGKVYASSSQSSAQNANNCVNSPFIDDVSTAEKYINQGKTLWYVNTIPTDASKWAFVGWVKDAANDFTDFYNTTYVSTDRNPTSGFADPGTYASSTADGHGDPIDHSVTPYYYPDPFPITLRMTAVYRSIKPDVIAVSNNGELGATDFTDANNSVGETVVLSAIPAHYNSKFEGWYKNDVLVSKDNPYSFTVTNENKGTYTARFVEHKFMRIKNSTTNRYINGINDVGSMTNFSSLQLESNWESTRYQAGTVVYLWDYERTNPTAHPYVFDIQGFSSSSYYDDTRGVYVTILHDNIENTWTISDKDKSYYMTDKGNESVEMAAINAGFPLGWVFEHIDNDLETAENYFSLDPNKLVEVDGKYYTTLRTSWNILFNPEQMTPYVVTEVDEENGTFEMEPITGNIIPLNTPVIIETSSTDIEANRMVPTTNSGAVPSGNLLQASTKYFPNQAAPVANCKGLIKNANGQLAFGGDALTTVNGNEAYLSVASEVVLPKPIHTVTLAELVANGEVGETYEITDLTSVDVVDHDQLLICKDNNGYANKDKNTENYIDYMQRTNGIDTYDQSNWIGLRVPEGKEFTTGLVHGNRLSGVVGRLTDAVNPELQLTQVPGTSDGEAAPTAENLFIAPAFYGDNHQKGKNDKEYFFVQPKPMELANVEMAQWDGNKFIVPVHDEAHPTWNTAELSGEFEFNGAYLRDVNQSELQEGHIYKLLPAVVKLNTRLASGRDGSRQYVVYPLALKKVTSEEGGVITGLRDLTNPEVIGTDYYNTTGMRSSRPWPGVNIVVTRYSDGSRSAVKVVK